MGERQREASAADAGQPTCPGTADRTSGRATAGEAVRGTQLDEGNSAPAASAEGQPLSPIEHVRFDCIRGALYHDDREQHYATLHRAIMLITIASAMAAIAAPLQEWLGVGPTAFQFAAAIAAVIDIVWDVSGKARLHANLKRVAYDILADAEEPGADVHRLCVRVLRSAIDEPPIMHAVNALAYNKAAKSMGRPEDCRIELSGFATWFRHWRAFSETDFPDP